MSVAQIRALVVDDQPKMIESMRTRLGREIGWEVEWETAKNVDDGQLLMTSSAEPFDLIIADLMFPREDFPDDLEPRGLDLIKAARRHSGHTFILAITTGQDHLHDLVDDAKHLGAHHVVRRNDFSTTSQVHSPAAIAAEIREHLLDNGTVRMCEVTTDPRDPGIQGLLNQVGEATVARLYSKILAANGYQTSHIELRFLTPGASGASICTASAQVDGIGRMSHFLKLSQSKELLISEAERGRRAAEVLSSSHLLVQHRPSFSVGPVNDWYALGGPFIERATTLRNWLRPSDQLPEPVVIADVLETLFVDGLTHVYRDGRYERALPMASFSFTPYRQRCILQVLDELTEALERNDGGALGADAAPLTRTLKAFVLDRRLPGGIPLHDIPDETYVCHSHGDLHAANVLIATGRHPRPLLIDTSHFGMAHWAIDPAWLAVDLLMRSVDAGSESMLFTGFSTWRNLAARFGGGKADLAAVTSTPATSAALAALSWIASNLDRITPMMSPGVAARHRWEWHMALARSLLRCTYHTDIPHAKRALAFVAAHDQLNAAAEALPG
jgi:CheY-like chemotaxis protein